MTRTASQTDTASKRQQILAAAQKCFARYGFAKTTLDDIAAVVGMKKASLYYYYENKESIFRDVIEHESNELLNVLTKQIASQPSPSDKLRSFARARLEHFRRTINLHDLSIKVILEVKPIINILYHDFCQKQVDLLKTIIEEGIQSGVFKPCNSEEIAAAILTVLEAVELKEFQNADVQSARDIDYDKLQAELETILSLMIDGLKQS